MTRTTTARVAPAPGPAAPTAPGPAGADPGEDTRADARRAAAPVTPTLAGEIRGTALLFALALTVTVGAAAVARAFPGLTP